MENKFEKHLQTEMKKFPKKGDRVKAVAKIKGFKTGTVVSRDGEYIYVLPDGRKKGQEVEVYAAEIDLIKEGVFYKGQNITIVETEQDGVIAKIGANTQMVQFPDGSVIPYGTKELTARTN